MDKWSQIVRKLAKLESILSGKEIAEHLRNVVLAILNPTISFSLFIDFTDILPFAVYGGQLDLVK
jgi:hypothetical protein